MLHLWGKGSFVLASKIIAPSYELAGTGQQYDPAHVALDSALTEQMLDSI